MVTKLRDKGMSIDNTALTIEMLKARGYYNLVNRYKEDFLDHDTNEYPPHTHLTDLFYYHRVEDDLINILFKFTISFEQRLKEAMAYSLAKTWGVSEKQYLQPDNYRNRGKREKIINFIVDHIDKCSDNPTSYYKREYHQIPPWVMLSNLTLGQTRMLFSIFPNRQTKYVVGELLPIHYEQNSWRNIQPKTFVEESISHHDLKRLTTDKEFDAEVESRVQLLVEMVRNMLTIIKDFRNTFAHGNRLIGFKSNQNLTYKAIRIFVTSKTFTETEFHESGLGKNDLLAFMISLILMMDKFDTAYFIDQLQTWQNANIKTLESKSAFMRFLESCGLPQDFVVRLQAIEIEQTNKQKNAAFDRWYDNL